jgi:hypothetical protein
LFEIKHDITQLIDKALFIRITVQENIVQRVRVSRSIKRYVGGECGVWKFQYH